jgi:hypothetical protein
LSEVRLEAFDLEFVDPALPFRTGDTAGLILFEPNGAGAASLRCRSLHDIPVDPPIDLAARFQTSPRLLIENVELSVAAAPLAALSPDWFGGQDEAQASGNFSGKIAYHSTEKNDTVTISGAKIDVSARELLAHRLPGVSRGDLHLEVSEAILLNGKLVQLNAHGQIEELAVGEVVAEVMRAVATDSIGVGGSVSGNGLQASGSASATGWLANISTEGLVQAGGRCTLEIDQLRYRAGKMRHLAVRGHIEGIDLEAWSAAFGLGRITGQASLEIHSLLVRDDHLQYADVELRVKPARGDTGAIDRDMLGLLVEKTLGTSLQGLLPNELRYTRLGVRGIIDGDELRLEGTHGSDGRNLLSVRLFGREMAIIRQPDRTFPVPDLWQMLIEALSMRKSPASSPPAKP